MSFSPASASHYVQEWHDAFLRLFPHRYDFIWAEHVPPRQRAQWQTERRYPLSDRVIQQGTTLYGVRFGAETGYALIDIDVSSPYHPSQDPFAIGRITAALEPLGLVRYLICTSSYSGGLHLYLPFDQLQSSWQLAIVLSTLIEQAGFKVLPGQLEIFPNPKPYVANQTPSLFNAHRLPLQAGSYLLNQAFEPIWSTQEIFVEQWYRVQSCNQIDLDVLKRILKQAKRRLFRISGRAEKFINDLNTEIEVGWTGFGQTNRLLGRIAMRCYVFHHILSGGQPLEGVALVEEIIEVARSLPGYEDWCRHRHEIAHRAEEWARCVESSHYFHYGDESGKFKAKLESKVLESAVEKLPSWNQQRSEGTRDRIRSAIADLLNQNALPANATARFKLLLQYKIGGASLYKHRDLWHPQYLPQILLDDESYLKIDPDFYALEPKKDLKDNLESPKSLNSDIENSDIKDISNQYANQPTQNQLTTGQQYLQIRPQHQTSLLSSNDGNSLPGRGSSDSNSFDGVDGLVEPDWINRVDHQVDLSVSTEVQFDVYQAAQQAAYACQNRIHQESFDPKQIARMQQFLDSGDPILVAEAIAWAEINPGLLTSHFGAMWDNQS